MTDTTKADAVLCDDCPPVGYPTDKTRCGPCPNRTSPSSGGQPISEAVDNAGATTGAADSGGLSPKQQAELTAAWESRDFWMSVADDHNARITTLEAQLAKSETERQETLAQYAEITKARTRREKALVEAARNLIHRASMLGLSSRTPEFLSPNKTVVDAYSLEELRTASGLAQRALAAYTAPAETTTPAQEGK